MILEQNTAVATITQTLKANSGFLRLTLKEISKENATARIQGQYKNSHAYLAGHLLFSRYELAKIIGIDCENPYAEFFGWEAKATDGENYPSNEQVLLEWNTLEEKILNRLPELDDDFLAQESKMGMPWGEKTMLSLITFFTYHETWHTGQISAIRSELKLRPFSELAKH